MYLHGWRNKNCLQVPRWLQSSVGGEAVCTQEWSKEKPAASQSRTLSHAASFFLMHSKTTRAGRSMYRFQETSASGRLSSNGRWAAMLLNSTRFLCSNPKVPLKNHACAGVPLIVKRWLPSSSWAEAKTEEREGGAKKTAMRVVCLDVSREQILLRLPPWPQRLFYTCLQPCSFGAKPS